MSISTLVISIDNLILSSGIMLIANFMITIKFEKLSIQLRITFFDKFRDDHNYFQTEILNFPHNQYSHKIINHNNFQTTMKCI